MTNQYTGSVPAPFTMVWPFYDSNGVVQGVNRDNASQITYGIGAVAPPAADVRYSGAWNIAMLHALAVWAAVVQPEVQINSVAQVVSGAASVGWTYGDNS